MRMRWQPPQVRKLSLHRDTASGVEHADEVWEGINTPHYPNDGGAVLHTNYRMPSSAEPVG